MAEKKRTTDVKSEIADLNIRIGELTEALKRERADATNLRRRHAEQVAELSESVKADVIEDLLPVIDNLDRALSHVPTELSDNAYVKGVENIAKQFKTILKSLGVEKILSVGEVFNPVLHHAVSTEEGDGKIEMVCAELQPGYKIGDRVIRHAMVKVKC